MRIVVEPAGGTDFFGSELPYKFNANAATCMSGRLILNGPAQIRGQMGQVSEAHFSEAIVL